MFGFTDNPASHMINKKFLEIFKQGRRFMLYKYYLQDDFDDEHITCELLNKKEYDQKRKEKENKADALDEFDGDLGFGLFD
jgi:hypothetical protein